MVKKRDLLNVRLLPVAAAHEAVSACSDLTSCLTPSETCHMSVFSLTPFVSTLCFGARTAPRMAAPSLE